MPVDPATFATNITSNGSAFGLLGVSWPQLGLAIGASLSAFTLAPNTLVLTVDTGTAGAGTGIGAIVNNVPAALESSLQATFAAAGMIGEKKDLMVKAIAIGAAATLATAIAQTITAGVGVGAGVGSLISLPPTILSALLLTNFTANALAGSELIRLAKAIADGYHAYLGTLLVVTVVSGPPSIVPAAGSGTGGLV